LFAKLAHRAVEGVEPATNAVNPGDGGSESQLAAAGDEVSHDGGTADAAATNTSEALHSSESGASGASRAVSGDAPSPVRSPYPPNPPRSIRAGTPRNPRR
jgi:hypothetical protein